jgi:hypothetical protein
MFYKFILYVGNRSFIGNNFLIGQQRSWESFSTFFLNRSFRNFKERKGWCILMVSVTERVACSALFVNSFLFDTFDYGEGVRRIYLNS